MAGRQGHNARKGKQGFQETYDGPPELVDLPEYADEAEPTPVDEKLNRIDAFFDRMAKEQFEEKKAAGIWAAFATIYSGLTVAVFSWYLPAGGSPFIGWTVGIGSVLTISFILRMMIADTKRWGKNRDK